MYRAHVFFSVLSCLFLLSTQEESAVAQVYTDVTTQVGIVPSHYVNPTVCPPPVASGSASADYDNDGDIDLYVTIHGAANHLYNNQGDTNSDGLPDFVDVASAAGVDDPTGVSHSCVFIDYDNDGDQDLYVTDHTANKLFQNQLAQGGGAIFLNVTSTAGLADGGRAITSSWGDFNMDGFLDVYLSKHYECKSSIENNEDHLYMNNGNGTFTNVSQYLCPGGTLPCAQLLGMGFTAGWFDYDNDGDPDLYLVNDILDGSWYHNVLWRNDGPNGSGGWLFTDVSAASGTDIAVEGMGLGIGDYDNDGWLDLAFSNDGPNYLLRNRGDGTYEDVSEFAGIQRDPLPNGDRSVTWGTCFFDHDNDGLLDLFYVAGPIGPVVQDQPDAFFKNNGDGTFLDYSVASGLDDSSRGRSASMADYDGDGFVDIFIGNYSEPPRFFHNGSVANGNTNHWLTLTVEGTISNRDGIGARITATPPGGATQIREITSGPTYGGGDHRAAYFGLGASTSARIVVQWPSGLVEEFGDIAADQALHLVENSSIPCEDLTNLLTRCVSGSTIQARVTLSGSTEHAGKTVQFKVDDTIYPAVIATNGVSSRAQIVVPGAGVGTHTVSLISPSGCFDPVIVTCTSGLVKADEQWSVDDAQWNAEAATTKADKARLETRLLGNYPNPFNPTTTIRYTLGTKTSVSVRIYDLLGREIATLVDEVQEAGEHAVQWDGKNQNRNTVSTGIYIYRIQAGNLFESGEMIFAR